MNALIFTLGQKIRDLRNQKQLTLESCCKVNVLQA